MYLICSDCRLSTHFSWCDDSLSRVVWLSLMVIALGGWGMVSYLALANSHIQVSVPDELRGRVMSVYSFVFLGPSHTFSINHVIPHNLYRIL